MLGGVATPSEQNRKFFSLARSWGFEFTGGEDFKVTFTEYKNPVCSVGMCPSCSLGPDAVFRKMDLEDCHRLLSVTSPHYQVFDVTSLSSSGIIEDPTLF